MLFSSMNHDGKIDIKEGVLRYAQPLCIAVVFTVYMLLTGPLFGDDAAAYFPALSEHSIFGYLLFRYQTWSSRLFIDLVVALLVHIPILWKILTVLFAVSIYHSLVNISAAGDSLSRTTAACAVLFYPFLDCATTGWIATSVNYFWSIAALLYCISFFCSYLRDDSISKRQKTFLLIAFVFAMSQEQSVMLVFLATLTALVWQYCHLRKISRLFTAVLLLSGMVMIFILTCPGNHARISSEISYWLPEFEYYSIFSKCYMGLLKLYETFFIRNTLFVLLITSALSVAIWHRTHSLSRRLVALIPLLFVIPFLAPDLLSSFYPIGFSAFENTRALSQFFSDPGEISVVAWREASTWIPFLILLIVVSGITASLWFVAERHPSFFILTMFLFAAGFAASMVMGFSPTVWASTDRTAIFTWFLWCTAFLVILNHAVKSRRAKTGFLYALFVLAVYNILHITATMIL